MSTIKMTMAALAAYTALLAPGDTADAANNNYQFCYSPTYAAWRNFPEPQIDGTIENDQGWSNAFQYVSGTGVVDNNNQVLEDFRLLASANAPVGQQHLNLGFRVQNDQTFDNDDLIVIAFQFSGNRFGAITLHPVQTASGAIPGNPQGQVKYYTSATGSSPWTDRGNGAGWITWAATSGGDAACLNDQLGSCRWDVEMRVNINPGSTNDGAGPMPPPIATYVGISRVYHVGSSTTDGPTEEFAWPPLDPNGNATNMLTFDTVNGVPPPNTWGVSAVGSTNTCGGISFNGSDISALSTQSGCSPTIPQVGCLTTLTVNVHNNAVDAQTQAPKTFGDVQAEFLHAPFGGNSFGAFQPIGKSALTSVPSQIAPTPLSVQWTPAASSAHECILAKLSSSSLSGGVTFVNSGEFVNMAVLPLSEAKISPQINVKGLPAPSGGGPQRVRVRTRAQLQFAYADGALSEIKAGTLVAQMRWSFFVSRDTGRTITINGNRHRIMAPFSAYGLLLQHPMTPSFQTAFEKRNTSLLAKFGTGSQTAGRSLAARFRSINAALVNVAEKPAEDSFSTNIAGVRTVADTGERTFEVEVAVDGNVVLPTTISYKDIIGGSGGTGCCPGSSGSKTTPSKVAMLGMVVLAGAVVMRRRRRR